MSFPSDYNSLITRIQECSFEDLHRELKDQDARVRILGELVLHEQDLKSNSFVLDKVICNIPPEAINEEPVRVLFTYFRSTTDASDEITLSAMLNYLTDVGNQEMIDVLFPLLPIEHRDHLLKSMAFSSAIKGNTPMVVFFLGRGVDINAQDMLGNTLMHIAIENQHLDLFIELSNRNPNYTLRNGSGEIPLHIACKKGGMGSDFALVSNTGLSETENRFLVFNKENLNIQDNEGNTPIIVAAKTGNNNLFRDLFNQGANLQVSNHKGLTAIHHLAFNNNQILLNKLSNINSFYKNLERRLRETPFAELAMEEKIFFLPLQTPDVIAAFLSALSEEKKRDLIEEPIRIKISHHEISNLNCNDFLIRIRSQYFPLKEEDSEFLKTMINSIDPVTLAVAAEKENNLKILIPLFPLMDNHHQKVFGAPLSTEDF